jgi:LacI family transcriptional regulator
MMLKRKDFTLKDISKITGLSASTISNVLGNKGRFSKETKKKVIKAVRDYDYNVNMVGRALRLKKSKIIGVLIPTISSEYYFRVIRGMTDCAEEHKYTILMINYDNNIAEELAAIRRLKGLYIDGLILLGGFKKIDHLIEITRGIPTVTVDREIKNGPFLQVSIKNKSAMKVAVKYMCSLGHDDFGYIGFNHNNKMANVELRKEGFIEGLEENNKKIREDFIFFKYYSSLEIWVNGFYEYIEENLANKKKFPTVFLTQNDYVAITLLKYLRNKKIRVPQDISVMGFGNISLSDFVYPTLTTISHPKRSLGIYSIELLLKKIENNEVTRGKYFDSKLIVRESTSNPTKIGHYNYK